MFHRIQQYGVIEASGLLYRPRAYGDPRSDGTWDGWLIFYPLASGTAIAPPRPETTQSTLAALTQWAAGVTPVYLEGALARALAGVQQPPLIDQLTAAEYEALEDAERLETAAAEERTAADLDEAAAEAARGDAERLSRERLSTESALAATEEAAATIEADVHEQSARGARAIAADAARRRRSAQTEAAAQTEANAHKPVSKRHSGRKK
jgi:hypothetical protein